VHSETGLIDLVGPLWERRQEDAWELGFLAAHRHINRRGVVHGGMLMAFADQALGIAAWEANGRQAQATIQLDTHFVSPVHVGEFVRAKCQVVRRTRSLLFMSGICQVGPRVVLTATGIWKLVGGPSAAEVQSSSGAQPESDR
jgi:uncharacterized protein (TIGR00369 family)